MPTEMVCPRHYTLRTRDGHVVKFEPNVPKMVPDAVVAEAMAVNILPTSGFADEPLEGEAGKPIKINISPALREALIMRVISDMVKENDKDQFDGGGRPKAHIISERTGLTMGGKERFDYWDKYRQIQADNSELPTHKLLEPVLEIQYLTTPKDTRDYAEAMGVPNADIVGRPVSQQKKILLSHVLKRD